MINNSIFVKDDSGINCQTKYAKNTPENDNTSLYIAVCSNCIESVDLLWKQDIGCAISNDISEILKVLLHMFHNSEKLNEYTKEREKKVQVIQRTE